MADIHPISDERRFSLARYVPRDVIRVKLRDAWSKAVTVTHLYTYTGEGTQRYWEPDTCSLREVAIGTTMIIGRDEDDRKFYIPIQDNVQIEMLKKSDWSYTDIIESLRSSESNLWSLRNH